MGPVVHGVGLVMAGGAAVWSVRGGGLPEARGLATLLPLDVFTAAPLRGILGVSYVVAVIVWVQRRSLAAALVIAALLALWTSLQGWQWPPGVGVNNGATLPALSVLAWAVARAWTRDDAVAHEAACGTVAAGYTLAALSKLVGSGLSWATAGNLAQHIATHAWYGGETMRSIRLAVASSPGVCGVLGVATILIEGSGVLFLIPRWRLPWVVAVAGMHLGISAIMGLHHYDWMPVALGLALGDPRIRPTVPQARAEPP